LNENSERGLPGSAPQRKYRRTPVAIAPRSANTLPQAHPFEEFYFVLEGNRSHARRGEMLTVPNTRRAGWAEQLRQVFNGHR